MSLSDADLLRLPSGRHRLSRERVSHSQRLRMLAAMFQAVGERGWAGTRIADVVSVAGVSRATFYEHFSGIDECLAEALDAGLSELLDILDAEARRRRDDPGMDLPTRMRAFFDGYVFALKANPGFATVIHVETLRSTDLVRAHRAVLLAKLASRVQRAYEAQRRVDPTLQERPESFFLMLVGGMDEIMRERIRTLGADTGIEGFADEAAQLTTLALVPDRAPRKRS